MTKYLFVLLTAGTLMVPLATSAPGEDGTVGLGVSRGVAQAPAWDARSGAPVPYLDTMRWLYFGQPASALGAGHLFSPKLQTLGPFLLPPVIPPARFSWDAVPSGSRPTTE